MMLGLSSILSAPTRINAQGLSFLLQCMSPELVEADIGMLSAGSQFDPERTIGAAFCRDAQRNIACNNVVPSFQAEGAG